MPTTMSKPAPPAEPAPRPQIETLFALYELWPWKQGHLRQMREVVRAVVKADDLASPGLRERLLAGRTPAPVVLHWDQLSTSTARREVDGSSIPPELRDRFPLYGGTWQADEVTFRLPFEGDAETLHLRCPVRFGFSTLAGIDYEGKALVVPVIDWAEDGCKVSWGNFSTILKAEVEQVNREMRHWAEVVRCELAEIINNHAAHLRAEEAARRKHEEGFR